MPDMTPAQRFLSLLRILSARRLGCSLQELADETSVSVKTIRRDLQVLKREGFPLEEKNGPHGRKAWKLADGASQPQLTVNLAEVASMIIARRLMEPLAGTLYWDGTQSLFRKLQELLPESSLTYLRKVSATFYQTNSGHSDYSSKDGLIDQLVTAIKDRNVTSISYQSDRATEPVSYEIHPYGIAYHNRSLYLVAYSTDHRQERHFKLDRLESVDRLELRFPAPGKFNLQDHFSDTFGIFKGSGKSQKIRIRFHPKVARYVEEKCWHPSQKLKRQKDGCLIAEFQLSSTDEIRKWVMSFGRNAVVLEPKEMRDKVRSDLRELIEQYQDVSQPDPERENNKMPRNTRKPADS